MRTLALPIFLAVSACGAAGPLPRTPDARVADEIEAKLRNVPCVDSIDRWERHYVFSSTTSLLAELLSFGTNDRWFDYSSIDIRYYQAGFEEFKAGRVLGRSRLPMADDREYDLVIGRYDIQTHTAFLWACGPNMGADSRTEIVVR